MEEKPANTPISARAAKNCQTFSDMPISAVKNAIAQLERISIGLRPCRSASRPHSGEANAATNEVEPFRMPDHRSMPASVVTPRSGRNSGMIGLRKLNDMVMMNWMPTMAHSVVCQEDSPRR